MRIWAGELFSYRVTKRFGISLRNRIVNASESETEKGQSKKKISLNNYEQDILLEESLANVFFGGSGS